MSKQQFLRQALAIELAETVAQALRDDLKKQAKVTLLVSGGSTPKEFFYQLSLQPLSWAQVTISLVDERWLEEKDLQSNSRLVRELLLQNQASQANFVSLMNDAATPEAGLAETTLRVCQLPQPFSVVILGMGNDGHTASLFPDSPQLNEGLTTLSPLLAAHSASVPQARITFSYHALSNARRIFVHLQGEDKKAKLAEALLVNDPHKMPICAFLQQRFALYWAA